MKNFQPYTISVSIILALLPASALAAWNFTNQFASWTVPAGSYNAAMSNFVDIDASGTFLYSATMNGFMRVYNISNPASPVLIATTAQENGTNYGGVKVSGNYAYLLVENGTVPYTVPYVETLVVYDISNPGSPQRRGAIVLPAYPPTQNWFDIEAVVGTTVYISGNATGCSTYGALFVVDASNPWSPSLAQTIGSSICAPIGVSSYDISGVTPSGTRLYVVEREYRRTGVSSTYVSAQYVGIYDISTPTNPIEIGKLFPGYSNQGPTVAASGNTVYTSGDMSGTSILRVYDTTNPSSPALLGQLSGNGFSYMELVGPYGYGVYGTPYTIFNLSNSSNPYVQVSNNMWGNADVHVRSNWAMTLYGGGGIPNWTLRFYNEVPPTYNLTVNVSGSGTVTSSPGGISCPSTCTAAFATGQSVTLTASPSAGYSFSGWSGGCSGTGTCNVNSAQTVNATFTAINYTYNFNGNGATTPPSPTSRTQAYGSLLSGPSTNPTRTGHTLTGWSPAIPGTMPVNGGTSFAQWSINQYLLTITPNGGSISGTCSSTCNVNYNQAVTLNQTPPANYTFTGWSGACSGTGSCSFSMPAGATAVTANYARNATINSFSVSPSSVDYNSPSTLNWNVSDATWCTINQGIGSVASTNGAHSQTTGVRIQDTTFTLTCGNATGPNTVAQATLDIRAGCVYGYDDTLVPYQVITTMNVDRTPIASGARYKVTKFGGNYCFGNNGGPTYLVPLNTWTEFLSFWTAITRTSPPPLPGMYVIP